MHCGVYRPLLGAAIPVDTDHCWVLNQSQRLLGAEESLETTEFPDDCEEDGDIVIDDDEMVL